MKIFINRNIARWVMTGLLGKDAKWFLGFSRQLTAKELYATKRNQD